VTARYPADMPRFEPGFVLAGYRLEAKVGEGGMAVVYRARDERLHRLVALKILAPEFTADAEFRQRFIRESEAAARVDHPHIIPIYLAGDAGAVLFIAMRFVPGGDLRQVIEVMKREGPLSAARVMEIISPVASALDAAHIAGLVHRDVKPGNILVDTGPGRPDHVLLSDFGISKNVTTAGTPTGTGRFIGTAGYSAPEQIKESAVDGRADQYALACVTYELLTGETVFQRQSIYGVLIAHVHEQAPSLTSRRPDLPFSTNGVMARALAKNPRERYPSCADFADALRDVFRLPPYRARRTALQPAQDQPPARPPELSEAEHLGAEACEIPSSPEAPTIIVPTQAIITELPGTRADTALVPVPEEAVPIQPPPAVRTAALSATAPVASDEVAEAPLGPGAIAEREAAGEPRAEAALEPEVAQAAGAADELEVASNLEAAEAPAPPGTDVAGEAGAEAVAAAGPVVEPLEVAEAEAAAEAAETWWTEIPSVLDHEVPADADPPTEAGLFSTPTTWAALAADLSTTGSAERAPADVAAAAAFDLDSATDARAADDLESVRAPGQDAGPHSAAVSDVPAAASPAAEMAGLRPPVTASARDWRRRVPVVAGAAIVVGVAVTIPFMLKSPGAPAHPQLSVSPPAAVTSPVTPPQATRIPLPASLSRLAISSVSFSPTGSTLAVAGALGTCLMDVATHNCAISLAGADAITFGPHGTILAGSDDNGVIQLWHTATGRQILPSFTDPDTKGALSVAFSPDGNTLAVGDQNGTTYLWNVAARNATPRLLPDPGSKGVNAVAFSPDGTMLAVGDENGNTYLWNVATGRLIASLPDSASNGVWSAAFSPDGKTLAAGDGNGHSYLWNVTAKKLINSFSDTDGQGVRSLAFSPNGTVLATGDHNGNTYLWNVHGKTLITSLSSTHDHGVDAVAFSRDGKTLITGNEDGAVDSWPISALTSGD